MANERSVITIKTGHRDSIKDAIRIINAHGGIAGKKATISNMIGMFAEALETYSNADAMNTESWMIKASPIILNSNAAKHYRELKVYEPDNAMNIVTDYIVMEAMKRRYENIGIKDEQ